MGICFTNTTEFKVISINDSALTSLDPSIVMKYELSRDVNDLPLDTLKALPDPPVIFTVQPLSVDYEHVTMQGINSAVARAIFREHVTKVENASRDASRFDQDGKLKIDCVGKYPIALVSEIVTVIVEAQDRVPGGTVPFSPSASDTFKTRRSLSRQATRLAAMADAARTGGASDSGSD